MAFDDREQFLQEIRSNALALGRDAEAFDAAVAALLIVDKYKYAYLWTWLGVPIIQLPADILATQEVVWRCRPDIIIETGVARGGSLILLASLLELIGTGTVIGVDIDIRAHNRKSIEDHPLSKRIQLVEGSSTSIEVLDELQDMISSGVKVMVILDSNHSFSHVLAELRVYAPLVSAGQYLVVADTLLGRLTPQQTPTERSAVWRPGNDPLSALQEFMNEDKTFEIDEELNGKLVFASSPGGYIRKKTSSTPI